MLAGLLFIQRNPSCRKWSLRHNSSSLGQRKRRVVAVGLCWDLHDGWIRIHLEHESFLCFKRGFPGHGSIPLFPFGISTGRWTCMYLWINISSHVYVYNQYLYIYTYRYVTHLSAIYYYIIDCSIVRNWHEVKTASSKLVRITRAWICVVFDCPKRMCQVEEDVHRSSPDIVPNYGRGVWKGMTGWPYLRSILHMWEWISKVT